MVLILYQVVLVGDYLDNVNIRKATLEDLSTIQELNNSLFKLEKENYDPTLVNDWPLSEEGKDYFSGLINNHYVIVALLDNRIVGYLAGSIEEKGFICRSTIW